MVRTVAFIPVRGGSKSIPLKNIKPFCGKPLVCWNIEALEKCDLVNEIVVATDSDEIEDVVLKMRYRKTIVYRRSAENASDTASTESVMLEYISKGQHSDDTVFILVQATSPLTQSNHFDEALSVYSTGEYDSMLSCVRSKRFFWNDNGTSRNYDYRTRPRRQDFSGDWMENGAFYINTVGNILRDKNRLSGKIGIYGMPEYTSIEIDEPDDWIVLENIMRRNILSKRNHKNVKLFLCDVDGTLTDGGMYYSENGDELKKFNTRDGMGLKILRDAGVKVGIITSEDRMLNERRAQKLQLDFLYQGKQHGGKLEVARKITEEMGISLDDVAYIGDDINCYELLTNVGMAACPNDAEHIIKSIPNIHIMKKKGGEGCVREFVEYLLS